jgi:hypothetical protein
MEHPQLSKLSNEQLIQVLVKQSIRGAISGAQSDVRKVEIISDEVLRRMSTRRPGRPTKR